MTGLNEVQVVALLKPLNPKRVLQANGQAHIPAYDIAAHLTRVLGFGNWDTELLEVTMLFESPSTGERPKWTVGYAATIKLIIKDENGREIAHWENGACGDAINQPSRADAHHLAMTTAISTALKRCAAFGLGDQFGLCLYNKGKTEALVKMVLVGAPVTADGEPVKGTAFIDLESHVPTPESLGNDERQTTEGQDIDYVTELKAALQASGLTNIEAKSFVEEAIGQPLGERKFSALTQAEARIILAKLKALVLDANAQYEDSN